MFDLPIFGALAFSASGVQILLQVICAHLAYRTARRYSERSKCWYYIAGAFGLMALRRVTALVMHQEPIKSFMLPIMDFINVADGLILPLSISVLLFLGLNGVVKCTTKNMTFIDFIKSDRQYLNTLKQHKKELDEK